MSHTATEQDWLLDAYAKDDRKVTEGLGASVPRRAGERRGRERVSLRWPITISRNAETGRVVGVTENLSSTGFYCSTPTPLRPREEVRCRIVLPGLLHHHPGMRLLLLCWASIVRVTATSRGYGVGFHILDYVIVEQPDLPAGK